MGWRTITALVMAGAACLIAIACTYTSACRASFSFMTPVSGGARNCMATFSTDAASVTVSIGDMDAGCSASTHQEQVVSCVSAELPNAFSCWRMCNASPPDILQISATDDDAAARIRTSLGDPPIDQPVPASVVCNGSVVSTDPASLEQCAL